MHTRQTWGKWRGNKCDSWRTTKSATLWTAKWWMLKKDHRLAKYWSASESQSMLWYENVLFLQNRCNSLIWFENSFMKKPRFIPDLCARMVIASLRYTNLPDNEPTLNRKSMLYYDKRLYSCVLNKEPLRNPDVCGRMQKLYRLAEHWTLSESGNVIVPQCVSDLYLQNCGHGLIKEPWSVRTATYWALSQVTYQQPRLDINLRSQLTSSKTLCCWMWVTALILITYYCTEGY